jgi:hypothetical protein
VDRASEGRSEPNGALCLKSFPGPETFRDAEDQLAAVDRVPGRLGPREGTRPRGRTRPEPQPPPAYRFESFRWEPGGRLGLNEEFQAALRPEVSVDPEPFLPGHSLNPR